MTKIFNAQTKSFLKQLVLLTLIISLPLTVYVTLKGSFEIRKKAAEDKVFFYLFPSSGSFSVGEEFEVNIQITTPEDEKLVIATAVLNFDPSVLKVNSITGSDEFKNQMWLDCDDEAGVITIKQGVAGGDPAVAGDIDPINFATIKFEGISETGTTTVSFDEEALSAVSDEAAYLAVSAEGGSYEILGRTSGSGKTIFTPACGPAGIGVTIIGEGFGTTQGEVFFDETAAPILSWTEDKVTVKVPSSFNPGATPQISVAAGGKTSTATAPFLIAENPPQSKADMNCDGVVNSFDLGILAHFWSGE